MTEAILALFAALMIFFVLTETLTIKLITGENYIVEINFIVFAVVLKKSKAYKEKRTLKKKNKTKDRIFRSALIVALLRKSSVEIKMLRVFLPDKSPSKNAMRFGLYNTLVFSFLAFLENNSKFFKASNITLSYSAHNNLKKQLDAEFKISLSEVLITTVTFLIKEAYYRLSTRRIRKND